MAGISYSRSPSSTVSGHGWRDQIGSVMSFGTTTAGGCSVEPPGRLLAAGRRATTTHLRRPGPWLRWLVECRYESEQGLEVHFAAGHQVLYEVPVRLLHDHRL